MMMCNSLSFDNIKINEPLYLVRYSTLNHPDYITVLYKSYVYHKHYVKYENIKGITKKIKSEKAQYRLFIDINEMARSLYECFIRRNVEIYSDYKSLFLTSQDVRPELWI